MVCRQFIIVIIIINVEVAVTLDESTSYPKSVLEHKLEKYHKYQSEMCHS